MQTERELMKQEKAHLETERILANKERERHKRAELDLMRKHQMKIREIEAAHEEDLRKMRMMLDDYKEKKLQDQGLVNQLQARNREMSVQLNDARKRAQTLPAKNDAAGDIDPDEYALKKKSYSSRDVDALFGSQTPKKRKSDLKSRTSLRRPFNRCLRGIVSPGVP